MAQIVPKLNLNKTPAKAENNSLVFAKNIRLDVDNTIHRDYGIVPMSFYKRKGDLTYLNYDNIIKRIMLDLDENDKEYFDFANTLGRTFDGVVYDKGYFSIVGKIADSNDFYIFISGNYLAYPNGIDNNNELKNYNYIIKYSEKDDKFYTCDTNWTYSGGRITGSVVNNLRGETILNVGEYDTSTNVPLKHINLTFKTKSKDESLYTQTPNIPITNLNFIGFIVHTIPNGTYQFFVRYKIRDNHYTDWFPATKELFIGNKETSATSFGKVSFVNTHRSSDHSFAFNVEHLYYDCCVNYDSFQIGFICASDEEIVARAWKHFDFNTSTICFDYKDSDAYEIEVLDLTKTTYQIYNVKNIASFKNKLYISNYLETNFNEDNLQQYANRIKISIGTSDIKRPNKVKPAEGVEYDTYAGYPCITKTIGVEHITEQTVVEQLIIDNTKKYFYDKNANTGILHYALYGNDTLSEITENSVAHALNRLFNEIPAYDGGFSDRTAKYTMYGITAYLSSYQTLADAKDPKNIKRELAKKGWSILDGYTCYDQISEIEVNGTVISSIDNNIVTDTGTSATDLTELFKHICSKELYLNYNAKLCDEYGAVPKDNVYDIILRRQIDFDYKANNRFDTWADENSADNIVLHGSSWYEQQLSIKFIGDKDLFNLTGNEIEDPDIEDPDNPDPDNPDSGDNDNDNPTVPGSRNDLGIVNQLGDENPICHNTTLIPFQEYKFYVHYIKQSGETTNGYYCNNDNAIATPYKEKTNVVIYPIFDNISIPNGYVGCFFSIVHVGKTVSTVFNTGLDENVTEATSLDLNIGLLTETKNITVKGPGNHRYDGAQYYYSSDTSKPKYFGADGVLVIDGDTVHNDNIEGKASYIVNNYTTSKAEDIELVKCTPFIDKTTNKFDDYTQMNLLGYICDVYALARSKCIEFFTDGSSAYRKIYNTSDSTVVSFDELRKYKTIPEGKSITNFGLFDANVSAIIYSNWNLNFMCLSENLIERLVTYYNKFEDPDRNKKDENGNITNGSDEQTTVLMRVHPSLTLNYIYDLPTMYKVYTRKVYSIYKKDEIIQFDNTIRSSELVGDEAYMTIFRFNANDYYNVPTNRGIITNLLSVGDILLVHTKDSMFKFSGSNTIQSSDGEIQPVENNVFDTGVSEIFGSDFGFAGLQNKEDSITTETGYIFFDRDSRIVYMYSGQGQISKLSDSIEKLFRHKDIFSISFANDYYNNRFFMGIRFIQDNKIYPVTLSFNLGQEVKSFVSLHDFSFTEAFNTKVNCYFLTSDVTDICRIDKEHKACYTKLALDDDKTYPSKQGANWIVMSSELGGNVYTAKHYDSIVDIIDNSNFEMVKTLNAVNWCGNIIESEFREIEEDDITTLKMAEDTNRFNPCKAMRIYTDGCMTPLCDFSKIANDYSAASLNSYKYPRFNQGYWTFNYFRNIQNTNDNSRYLGNINNQNQSVNPPEGEPKYDDGRRTSPSYPQYISDNNSLIEGKYFIVRMLFDSEFKLEALTLNYDTKQ